MSNHGARFGLPPHWSHFAAAFWAKRSKGDEDTRGARRKWHLEDKKDTSCYLAIPTRGFTAVVSVFRGTPPPKPLYFSAFEL